MLSQTPAQTVVACLTQIVKLESQKNLDKCPVVLISGVNLHQESMFGTQQSIRGVLYEGFRCTVHVFSKPSVVPSSDGGLFGKPLVNTMRDCVRIPLHHHTTAYMYEVMTPDFDRPTEMLRLYYRSSAGHQHK